MSEHMEMLKTLYDSANRESETPEAFIEIFTPRLKEALHDEAFLLFCMQNDMDVISLLSADSKYSKSQLNLEVMWHPTFSSLDALTQLEFIYQNRFYYPFLNEQGDKRYYASINPIAQEDHLEYLRTRHIDDDCIGLMGHLSISAVLHQR